MTCNCVYCNNPLDPADGTVWRRVVGFERKASGGARRGGSDIALRTPSEHWACDACVTRKKRGLNHGQGSMFE